MARVAHLVAEELHAEKREDEQDEDEHAREVEDVVEDLGGGGLEAAHVLVQPQQPHHARHAQRAQEVRVAVEEVEDEVDGGAHVATKSNVFQLEAK